MCRGICCAQIGLHVEAKNIYDAQYQADCPNYNRLLRFNLLGEVFRDFSEKRQCFILAAKELNARTFLQNEFQREKRIQFDLTGTNTQISRLLRIPQGMLTTSSLSPINRNNLAEVMASSSARSQNALFKPEKPEPGEKMSIGKKLSRTPVSASSTVKLK
jgi:hypothetical protein